MPALARRRDPNVPQECWRVYYDDAVVGTIARCVGNPGEAPKWQWRCGFYPGSRPGECTGGTAATFQEVRAAFEIAWRAFLSKRTEADFRAWRDHRDWNTSSPHWRIWLRPEHRCLVPANSFAEYAPEPNPETKKKDVVWFALNEDRPLFAFGGIWTTFNGDRGTKSKPVPGPHNVYGFLTTTPNSVVEPIHPKRCQ